MNAETTSTDHAAVTYDMTLDGAERRMLNLIRALRYEQETRAAYNALDNRTRVVRNSIRDLEMHAEVAPEHLAPLVTLLAGLEQQLKSGTDQTLLAANTVNELADALPSAEAELLILLGQRLGSCK